MFVKTICDNYVVYVHYIEVEKLDHMSTYEKVRLINDDGSSSVVTITVAENMARYRGLDLVIVDQNVSPPAAKIFDHGKFVYEQNKKKRAAAKLQREVRVNLKEIQIRPVTGDNDVRIKAKNARKFLDNGDQVKITIKYRGRELNNRTLGNITISKFLEYVGDHKIIQEPVQNGNGVTIVIGK